MVCKDELLASVATVSSKNKTKFQFVNVLICLD
jgi:hypothetical protein